MQLIILATCLLSLNLISVFGDDDIPDIGLVRKLRQTRDMLSVLTGWDDDTSRAYLNKYGCYCYAGDNTVTGPIHGYRGDPVDELDGLCKNLYTAQKCIKIDSENDFYSKACDLESTTVWYETASNEIMCGKENNENWNNKNTCRINTCELEKQFAHAVYDLIISGFNRNDAFRVNTNQYSALCVTEFSVTGSQNLSLECCGNTFNRHAYNSLIFQCCADGSIKTFGSCF